MIHYIYTTMFYASKTAEPLMRPMWSEFPEQQEMYDIESQFMFGTNLLVAPKITTPSLTLSNMHM